ncbi:MAG: T9SS type A sorting domain-containing protein [Bacteroidales bacterium]|nr:T9SS type A sorting domain-containing protein [Bacteroidales bacterium]
MMKRKQSWTRWLAIVSMLMVLHGTIVAQRLAMHSWRTHFSYTATNQLTQSKEYIYAVSDGALYSVLKRDFVIKTFSKVTELNDNGIAQIAFQQDLGVLVVAYDNANIDLLYESGGVENIPDIQRKSMTADKTIHDILIVGNTAYLACGFGIVAIDLKRVEISGTYYIGSDASMVPVLSLASDGTMLYAVTKTGVRYIELSNTNMVNYANWHKIEELKSENYVKMVCNGSQCYLLDGDNSVSVYDGAMWTDSVYTNITNISANDGVVMLMQPGKVTHVANGKADEFVFNMPKDVVFDTERRCFWLAAEGEGVGRVAEDHSTYYFMRPEGPATNLTWRMKSKGEKLIAVPGGRFAQQYFRPGQVMVFEDNQWTNITNDELMTATGRKCEDFVDVAIDPNDDSHFFVASYGMGLYEFRNNEFYQLLNADNSGIETIYPEQKPSDTYYAYHRIDGLTYDNDGNLWMLNSETTSPIKYLDSYGVVHRVEHQALRNSTTLQQIVILRDYPNIKLVLLPRANAGVFAFDDNGTPDYIGDDKTVLYQSFYDQQGKKITPTFIYDMTQDLNGDIWLGTSSGVLVLSNPYKIFNSNYTATSVLIRREDGTNNADYLLDNVQVNAITVDAANRKWIATATSGVYLMSEDGKTEVHHFTAENSPLLDNNVQCIGINQMTGEVFFGTSKGIISFQSDAQEALETTFSKAHAFPNPVRPEYSGVITITGLTAGTQVYITDAAGNMVYQTESNGSLATWSGNKANGERVATGVYFAHCFTKDKKQKTVVKILVVR